MGKSSLGQHRVNVNLGHDSLRVPPGRSTVDNHVGAGFWRNLHIEQKELLSSICPFGVRVYDLMPVPGKQTIG